MKKQDIVIGGTYTAKVSDRIVDVRIDAEHRTTGWTATNLATGKTVHIKSAARLRAPVPSPDQTADEGHEVAQDATGAKTKKPRARKAAAKADAPRRNVGGGRGGILDLAAGILADATEPMSCKAIVEIALERKAWSTTGKTPAATLYAAIVREIASKGVESRFRKTDRGMFVRNAQA